MIKNGFLKVWKKVFIILIAVRPQNFTAGIVENYEFRKPQENSWYPV